MKHCSGCNRTLWVVFATSDDRNGTTFNRKTASPGGLQPWCRECDYKQKNSTEHGWQNLYRFLKREEPQHLHLWTRDEYLRIAGSFECHWCGTYAPEWGGSHWMDRTSNSYGHIPDNCEVACSPCNFHRGAKPAADHVAWLEKNVLARCDRYPSGIGLYRWGRIPWDQIRSASRTFRRWCPPDLSAWVVTDPTPNGFNPQLSFGL